MAGGSPSHDSVVLWTRLVQTGFLGRSLPGTQGIPVRWELAHDDAFTRIAQSGQTVAGFLARRDAHPRGQAGAAGRRSARKI